MTRYPWAAIAEAALAVIYAVTGACSGSAGGFALARGDWYLGSLFILIALVFLGIALVFVNGCERSLKEHRQRRRLTQRLARWR